MHLHLYVWVSYMCQYFLYPSRLAVPLYVPWKHRLSHRAMRVTMAVGPAYSPCGWVHSCVNIDSPTDGQVHSCAKKGIVIQYLIEYDLFSTIGQNLHLTSLNCGSKGKGHVDVVVLLLLIWFIWICCKDGWFDNRQYKDNFTRLMGMQTAWVTLACACWKLFVIYSCFCHWTKGCP